MYILDTDHLSILQRSTGAEYSRLVRRIATVAKNSLFTTIVSFHEQAQGWIAYISRAQQQPAVVKGYGWLERLLGDYGAAQVLPFDEKAADRFESLKQQRIRVGTMDLRIAAIVLVHGMTLISRNLVHFRKIPGLTVEDWTA